MPVLSLMGHLALINTDRFTAGIAVLGEEGIEAVKAEGATITHDVPLTPQLAVTFEAGKMTHVPRLSLCLCALVGKDDLVTRGTSGFEALRVVPSAVQLAFLVEVDEVYKQLTAGITAETGRMPAAVGTCP